MVVNCPHCGKQLKMSDKMLASIKQLDAGKKVKVKCVHCAVPFGLGASDLVAPASGSGGSIKQKTVSSSSASGISVKAPGAPDTSWLQDGVFDDQDVVGDIPRALVLMPDTPARKKVNDALEALGYQVEQALQPLEAISKMRFINYAAVILDNRYEKGGLESSVFHRYMRGMEMARRRFIFYVLIGDEFNTLYDLQALVSSANLVVNDTEVPFIGTIFKKAFPEYETLFGPLMEELRIAGK